MEVDQERIDKKHVSESCSTLKWSMLKLTQTQPRPTQRKSDTSALIRSDEHTNGIVVAFEDGSRPGEQRRKRARPGVPQHADVGHVELDVNSPESYAEKNRSQYTDAQKFNGHKHP